MAGDNLSVVLSRIQSPGWPSNPSAGRDELWQTLASSSGEYAETVLNIRKAIVSYQAANYPPQLLAAVMLPIGERIQGDVVYLLPHIAFARVTRSPGHLIDDNDEAIKDTKALEAELTSHGLSDKPSLDDLITVIFNHPEVLTPQRSRSQK